MDSSTENHAVIVRDEKKIRIPYGDEVLIVQCSNKNKNRNDKREKKIGNLSIDNVETM
nr:hypothetical protein [Tanacetum cinerariifolium]